MKRESSQVILYEFSRAEIVELIRANTGAIIPEVDHPTSRFMVHGIDTAVRIEVVYRAAAEEGKTP